MDCKSKLVLFGVALFFAFLLFILAHNPLAFNENDNICSSICGNRDLGYIKRNYKEINGNLTCICRNYGIPNEK
jgi:hypothetical protein